MTFEERQDEVVALEERAERLFDEIADAIRNAGSCEVETDFDANIKDALEGVEQLAADLKALLSKKKMKGSKS